MSACRWIGCAQEGTPRNIAVTAPAPRLGGGITVLATFSDDVPLCDEHDAAVRAMIDGLLREELEG